MAMTLDQLVSRLEGILGATIHEKGYFEGGDILRKHRLWISGFIENSHCILQTAPEANVTPLVIDLSLSAIRLSPAWASAYTRLHIALYDAIREGDIAETTRLQHRLTVLERDNA